MKNHFVFILFLALSCPWLNACDSGDNGDVLTCTADVCAADGKTLIKCDLTTRDASPFYCPDGCENGACKAGTPDKCSESVCLDAQTLYACDPDTGALAPQTCPNGCENGVCKEAETQKCLQSVCLDAQTLNICNPETGIMTRTPCLKGCENGACKDDALQKCTRSVCLDIETLNICNRETGAFAPINCPYGCENGVCLDKSTDFCTTDADCIDEISRSCVANRCVTTSQNLTDDRIGTACDESFTEFCDTADNAAVYCTTKGVVKKTACGDNKICLVSQTSTTADCYESDLSKDMTTCETVGKRADVCDDMSFTATTFVTKRQCEALSDGSMRYVRIGLEICDYACNANNTACATITGDGKTCSADAVDYCTGRGSSKCAVYQNNVICHEEEHLCNNVGEESHYCDESHAGDPVAIHAKCVLADDGKTKLMLQSGHEYCAISCDDTTGQCTPVTDDGKTCNDASARYCTSFYDGCAIIDGQMQCYSDDDKCDAVGQTSVYCDDSEADYDFYMSVIQTCTLADDEKTKINIETGYDFCDTMCSSDTGLCMNSTPVDGECSEGHLAICNSHGYSGCALFGGKPACHKDVCTTEGTTSNQCVTGAENTAQMTTTICMKSDKNSLVLVDTVEDCLNGCDANNTACATVSAE